MQNLHEILVQKKIKEIRFKAIASIVCGFLSIIPYLGVLFNLVSWILFFILLYDLKFHVNFALKFLKKLKRIFY
ncbi:hypothetical protein BOP98_09205 [Campylobacter coli]|nr:hypothetical protein BOP98_09205 [Campylobacter coli]